MDLKGNYEATAAASLSGIFSLMSRMNESCRRDWPLTGIPRI